MNHNIVKITSFQKVGTNDTNADFAVNFENHRSLHGIVKVVVKAVDVPNIFPNINSTGYNEENVGNNTYTYLDTASNPVSVVLPPGQYTMTQFLTALNALLLTSAVPHEIVFNDITKKLEFNALVAANFYVQNYEDGNIMGSVLGIKTSSVGAGITQYDAEYYPNLMGVESIYILSNQAGQSNLLSPNAFTFPLIAHVPLTVPFGGVEHYLSQHPDIDDIVYVNYSAGISLRKMNIKVVDKYGHPLDLGGLDINIILKIYHNL